MLRKLGGCYYYRRASFDGASNLVRLVSVPEVARVKSYTVLERNGFVYMWYHAEGVEPYWEPPELEEITSGEWKYRGRTEHEINCHIEVRLADRVRSTCVYLTLALFNVNRNLAI